MNIIVHTKTDCPWCVRAKEYLTERNIPFETKVYDDFEARNAMYDALGLTGHQRTVPQIVVDDVRIGGYSDLVSSDVADRYAAGNFDADF